MSYQALHENLLFSRAKKDPQKDNSPSVSGLVSTLIPVLIVASIYVLVFLLLRPRLKRNYAPRTYLGALRPHERSPVLPLTLFGWIGAFNKIPDTYVLNHHSLDGFLLLRYLKISSILLFVGCCITWPVLFPLNATGGGGQTQLNALSSSNVVNQNRLYAHTFIAWIYFGFLFYLIMRESIYYINLRQAYLLSPHCADRISSRTVLVTSVPKDYQNEAKLRALFGPQVKNLWIANETDEIEKLVEERDKVSLKLEAAETKLITLATKNKLKAESKKGATPQQVDSNINVEGESGSIAARWITPKQRPTHRLKPLIGKKVDTIDWCRTELERLIPQVNELQNKIRSGNCETVCSAFVEFYSQNEAQAAYQSLSHHQPLHMSPRFIGISPEEVIWKNLKINWASRVVRNILTTTFVTLLIVFWAIPVAFVGVLSNIKALTTEIDGKKPTLPWLSFINQIPPTILGLVQGLLPAVLLAVLMALLPIVLRLMARLSGKPSLSSIELRVQNSYFLFQVIQVFLVTTVSSAAAASYSKIAQDPGSVLSLLRENVPKASNFYVSYLILQGLTIASGALLQIVGVILFRLLGKFLDSTPRKMYKRFVTLSSLGWGTVFPIYTLLTVISLTYAIIAPLVLGFGAIAMYLIYLAYRYNLLFVFNASIDTKGLVYPRALQQTTTGIYLSIVIQILLFAVAKAIGPLILMIVFLIFAALFHMSMNSAIDPLLLYLPKSLENSAQDLGRAENGHAQNGQSTLAGSDVAPTNGEKGVPGSTGKPAGLFGKFFAPHKHADVAAMRQMLSDRNLDTVTYDPIVEQHAYFHPAVASPTPVVWIPRDNLGISRQEIAHTSRVIPCTDDGAYLNEKGKIVLDVAGGVTAGGAGSGEDGDVSGKIPIYKDKVDY